MTTRRGTLACALVLLPCVLVACGTRSDAPSGATARDIAAVAADTTRAGVRGRYALYAVRLRSRNGLVATGRLLVPPFRSRSPAVLLQNGRELNSHAVDYLPSEFGDVVVLSLDYPEELPYTLGVGDLLLRGDALQRAIARIPATFSLGAEYLAARDDVDTTRLVMVATSFAVPFAVRAAARDVRFANVALIYGAGRMADVLAANLDLRPRFLRPMAAWIAMRPFEEFAPERYIGSIAPRPVVMVNGSDDPQMPRRAVEALYAAAREPKSLIWLRTGHLMPGDTALIRALVDTAFARLPALRGVVRDSGGHAHHVVHDRDRVARAAAQHEHVPGAVPEPQP